MEQPPVSFAPDQREYLARMFNRQILENTKSNYFPPQNVLPEKVKVGRVYYFAQAIGTDITSEGFWGYISTGWIKL